MRDRGKCEGCDGSTRLEDREMVERWSRDARFLARVEVMEEEKVLWKKKEGRRKGRRRKSKFSHTPAEEILNAKSRGNGVVVSPPIDGIKISLLHPSEV